MLPTTLKEIPCATLQKTQFEHCSKTRSLKQSAEMQSAFCFFFCNGITMPSMLNEVQLFPTLSPPYSVSFVLVFLCRCGFCTDVVFVWVFSLKVWEARKDFDGFFLSKFLRISTLGLRYTSVRSLAWSPSFTFCF